MSEQPANHTPSDPDERPARVSMITLMLVALLVFLAWAAWFEIDQSVRAQGQLIPSARTQVIQAADGGVLSRILVHEGQAVTAGQELATLERDRPDASYEESRAKDAALAAALLRAQAEAAEATPAFGPRFKEYPQFVAVQQALFEQRQRSLREELATLQDGQDMAQQELAMNEALLQTGDTSQLEVMRARRQLGDLQGRASALRNKYLHEARVEAAKLAEDLSSSRYKLAERKSVLDHTRITAPVAGVVKLLKVSTIGGVLRPGDELMQISPTDGELVIELKLNPVDIGQLKVGLPATVKFDAFDSSVYGSLQGRLSYLSADTLNETGANGQTSSFYRAQVRLDHDGPGGSGAPAQVNARLAAVELKPGMTATVDIRTDSRSILKYLAKPVFKAFGGALNER
jgi:adhesin transport system membrane fusion protein